MHRILISIAAVASLVGQQPLQGRILLATVTDTGNRQLYDLDADDFVVDEGGATREVLSVHLADYPIGVLIDSSGDAAQLEAIRTARPIAAVLYAPDAVAWWMRRTGAPYTELCRAAGDVDTWQTANSVQTSWIISRIRRCA